MTSNKLTGLFPNGWFKSKVYLQYHEKVKGGNVGNKKCIYLLEKG